MADGAGGSGKKKPAGFFAQQRAKQWVQTQIMAEALKSQMSEEEPRQFTVRLNPVVAALFEALAARLAVSRNNAANILLGSALVEAVSAFPEDQRAQLLKDVEKSLGRRLDLTRLAPPEEPGVLRSMLNDMTGVVEDIKSIFRGDG